MKKKPKLKTITSPETNQTGMQIKKFGALYFNHDFVSYMIALLMIILENRDLTAPV